MPGKGKSSNGHEGNLEADDSAFIFFMFVMITAIVVPWILILLKKIIWTVCGWYKLPLDFACTCKNCSQLKEGMKKELKSSWLTKGLAIQIFIISILLSLLFAMRGYLDELKKEFDPYSLLEISTSASEQEIKAAYRRLVLATHPDKRNDGSDTSDKFMAIRRAYQALTDPVAKENYKKYGNPDGVQRFSIGLAVPTFLLEKGNKNVVLIVFFVFLLILVPLAGWWVFTICFRYNKHGVYPSNSDVFIPRLKKIKKADGVMHILSGALEYQKNINDKDVETEECKKLISALPSKQNKGGIPKELKIRSLIEASMRGTIIEGQSLLKDQQYIMHLAPRMLSYLIELSTEDGSLGLAVLKVLKFSQLLYQGLNFGDSPFLQLPHIDKKNVDTIFKQKAKNAFKNYLGMTPELRAKYAPLPDAEKTRDVEATLSALPLVKLTVKAEVKDSNEIRQGDLLTVQVKVELSRGNKGSESAKDEDGAPNAVHTNQYPIPKQEIMWIIIASRDEGRLLQCAKINRKFSSCTKEFSAFMYRAGVTTFEVYAKFDCYRGLDCKETVKIFAKKMQGMSNPKQEAHPQESDSDKNDE